MIGGTTHAMQTVPICSWFEHSGGYGSWSVNNRPALYRHTEMACVLRKPLRRCLAHQAHHLIFFFGRSWLV